MSKNVEVVRQKRAVVIIPTYNESANIPRIIPKLLEVFDSCRGYRMEILVVDDSSPDGTGDLVRNFSKKHDAVHLLTNAKKNGLGAAYLKGMKEAFEKLQADVVFEFDADLSHDPEKIPEFLKEIDRGAQMVLGSRYISGGSIPANWGLHRKFLSVVGNLFINVVLTTFAIRDWTTGYRAITREVYKAVGPEMGGERFSGYTFQIGFLHKAVRKGFRIAEVPFHFVDREMGHSKLGVEYLKNTLIYILKVRFQEITRWRFFKFALVGLMGFIINSIGLFIFAHTTWVPRLADSLYELFHLSFLNTSGVASALGAECAIVSNFLWNNFWTFRDRRINAKWKYIPKFVQFNLSSIGAVFIQLIVVGFGTELTGQSNPSRMFWLVIATGIGMVVNFTVYSKVIWRDKKRA